MQLIALEENQNLLVGQIAEHNSREKWNGGIMINREIPSEFKINTIEEDRLSFERGDGLVECWIRGKLPRPTQGWLEIMSGEHPYESGKIFADEAIFEGEEIAQNIIHSLEWGWCDMIPRRFVELRSRPQSWL